jgi:hypothetical protein
MSDEQPQTKPQLKAITAFTIVLLPNGYWKALMGPEANVEIDVDRAATADDLIPACAQVQADCTAARAAEYSLQRQMVLAQQIQAQMDSQRILSQLHDGRPLS